MPRTDTDTRRYTVELRLSHAEALQDALAGAYRAASLAATLRHKDVLRAGEGPAFDAATSEYVYALKRVAALDELMKAVGRHI